MFALAWPIVATRLLQVAYDLTDTLWLGRYSTAAVAWFTRGTWKRTVIDDDPDDLPGVESDE